jgi:hypothetical protein
VERVVLRALAKRPDDRYQSMAGFVSALKAATSRPVRRRAPVPASASATMALAVCVVLVMSTRAPTGAASSAPPPRVSRGPSIVQLPAAASARKRTAKRRKRVLVARSVIERDELLGRRL